MDLESHFSLPGATVVILNSDPIQGTVTDQNGKFKLENIPVGRYSLKISFIGYEPVVLKEILVGSGKEVILNIKLKESVISMKEVEIKATTNKDQPLNSMATLSARTLSMEEARRYAGGLDDPARLASSFAGVSGDLGNNGIVIRGNAPKGLLWRMEGVEISNPSHFANITTFGGGGITALSSQMLANSDFFTGAFPAEYGNALSGAFDMRMRNGNNEKREHTAQLGAMGIDFASEGPFVKGKNSSYLFNYRYSTLGLIAPLLPEDASGNKYQDLAFKLNFPTKKAGVFSVWCLAAADETGAKAEKDSADWKYQQDKDEVDGALIFGAFGVSHKLISGKKTFINTTIAASGNWISMDLDRMDNSLNLTAGERIKNNTWKYTLSSFINHKFSARHTNRTGIIYNKLFYDINIKYAENTGDPLVQIVNENGNSDLIQAYSQSKFDLNKKLALNIGVHSQYFTLNKNYTIEPRMGLKWKFKAGQALSVAYGNHSQLEMIGIYLTQQQSSQGIIQPNKNLDFGKAHHFVLGYDKNISENIRLKIEPYYQILYDIPVIKNSSFSMQNLDKDWFINDSLVNKGEGTNIGIDITLERFLNNGYYYLITASFFDSKYKGGDGIERNSRFNKNYVLNFLIGKEWNVGRGKKNILGVSGRLNFSGGNRIDPVDKNASLSAQEVIYDENRAFENSKPNVYYAHISFSYRKNKKRHASIWSLQAINVLGGKEFAGYRYNFIDKTIDREEEAIIIPSISYKIEF